MANLNLSANAPVPGVRVVFFVSDRTGLTAETYGKNLLAQFPKLEFETITLAFVDSVEKAESAVEQIEVVQQQSGVQAIVFSSLMDRAEQAVIDQCTAVVIDLFNTFLGPLEQALGMASAHTQGVSKTVHGKNAYELRLDAIDYALTHDDGVRPDQYDAAEIILVGVSRCGKTPTSLYLAMNFSLKACNYPLTEEDMQSEELPKFLKPYAHKLVGLTIKPVPLSRIRKKRRPGSDYASLQTCQNEVELAKAMFKRYDIPMFDTTDTSIEEIAGHVVKSLGLSQQRMGFA